MYFLLQTSEADLSKIETRDIESKLSLMMVIKKINSAIIAVSEYYGSGE